MTLLIMTGTKQTSFQSRLIASYSLLASARPRQWTKNLIVFAAPLFAFQINRQTLGSSLLALGLFCCLSSGFYLFNDIRDVESDRRHPTKCKRPIAAGLVSITTARSCAFILLAIPLIIGSVINLSLGSILISYGAVQISYNLWLKHTVLLDILAIATGFVLRAYGGAAATNIILSPWFILCTAMLALFLAIEKRKAELRLVANKGNQTRLVLKHYSLSLLSRMEGIVTSGTIITYALWSAGPQLQGASTSWMLLTLPFVLYGMFRYQLLSDFPQQESGETFFPLINRQQKSKMNSERPEEILLTDLPILLTICGWIITIVLILLLKNQGLIE